MGKFTFVLLLAFCLLQNSFYALAESIEQEESIKKIVEIVEQLTNEIKEVIEDLAKRLPNIVKNLEKNVRLVVDNVNLADIFENVKNDIENLVTDNNSISLECSKMAYDELEDIEEKTNRELSVCINKIHKKTDNIKNEVQKLMDKSNTLAQDMAKKIEKCAQENGADAIRISNCLQKETKTIKNMLKQIKETISITVDNTENITKDINDEINVCLQEIKVDTLKYTEHVIDELKSCNTEL